MQNWENHNLEFYGTAGDKMLNMVTAYEIARGHQFALTGKTA